VTDGSVIAPFYTSDIIRTVFVLALSVLVFWGYVSPQVPFHRKQSVFSCYFIKKRTVLQNAIRQYEIQFKLLSITVTKFLRITSYIQ